MLIEVKVKVARIIDNKTRKRTETYLLDKELFAEAEYTVLSTLSQEQEEGLVSSSEIVSLRQSPIKEVCDQWYEDYITYGYATFIATLKDVFHADDGTEKTVRYKVLLWARNHSQALIRVQELARQGYDMQIEGIKQVDYEYLVEQSNQEEEVTNE